METQISGRTAPRAAAPATRTPPQLLAGLALLALSWPAYWLVSSAYSEDLFFPLWLGYALTVDGLIRIRTGSSLLTRSPRTFLLLFPCSFVFWFSYEPFNHVVQNWHYEAPHRHGRWVWDVVQGITMTTVAPALWETAEFYRSFPALHRCQKGRWRPGPSSAGPVAVLVALLAAGLCCVAAPLAWPDHAYPLIWFALFLVFDPVNGLTGRPSLILQMARRQWGNPLTLTLTAFTCGFFWEFWNNWSAGYRWVYDIPYLNASPHLFEMPVAGYLGYVPFTFSAYAAYHFARGLAQRGPRLAGDAGPARRRQAPAARSRDVSGP